ncbi:MAG: ABC transporter permease [Acidobacteriota bacterium]
MDTILHDFRFALRSLLSRPLVTGIAVLTLALGIGANTAIFSVVYGVLLRPLGFEAENRLVAVLGVDHSGTSAQGSAFPDYWFLAEHQSSFEAMTFYCPQRMTLESDDGATELAGMMVGVDAFSLLGVEPALGRGFSEVDVDAGRGHTIVISHELWQTRFGGDPAVLGSTLMLDDQAVTLVGIAEPGLALPTPNVEVWQPVGYFDDPYGRFSAAERDFVFLGRLAEEVSIGSAQAEMDALAGRLAQARPATHEGLELAVRPLREHVVGAAQSPIVVAFAAVALVLLIACANIAHLLLVRALGRQREMAVRAALGADRGRLLRQLLTESVVLALAGGVLGVLAAVWLHELLLQLDPGILPRSHAIALDAPVLIFAFVAAVATGLLCGLVPALRASSVALDTLGAGSQRALGDRRQNRWQTLLLGAEMALALVLLSAAGMLLRGLYALEQVDPGWQPAGVHASHVLLDRDIYDPLPPRVLALRGLREDLARQPGIEATGLASATPVPGLGIQMDVPWRAVDDPPLDDETEARRAAFRVISPGYLDTVGMSLLAGRAFTDQDERGTPLVALVNRNLSRRWGDEPSAAIGESIEIETYGEQLSFEIVGVVGDTRFVGLHQPIRPALYLTHPQMPFRGIGIVVRSSLPDAMVANMIRAAVLDMDSSQPAGSVRSLERELAGTLGVERFFAVLLGLFAVLALILAAAGIYGVFSYWVGRRTGEIGLRMALGARAEQVLGQVLGEGLRIVAIGLGLGVIASLIVAGVVMRSFEGIVGIDWVLMTAVSGVLLFVALTACWLPARRAARVDPTVALRGQ